LLDLIFLIWLKNLSFLFCLLLLSPSLTLSLSNSSYPLFLTPPISSFFLLLLSFTHKFYNLLSDMVRRADQEISAIEKVIWRIHAMPHKTRWGILGSVRSQKAQGTWVRAFIMFFHRKQQDRKSK
jgi:hypothetical protein